MQEVISILLSLEFFCQSIQLLTVEISSDSAAIWKKFRMDNPIDSSLYAQYHLLRMWISLRRCCTCLTSAQPLASVRVVNVQHPLFIASNKIVEPLLVALGCHYDKIIDLMVANFDDHTVSVLLGNGGGTFQTQIAYATGKSPLSVISGDVNDDETPDLVVTNWLDDTMSVLLGNEDGTFREQITYATGRYPQSVIPGDFNKDNKPDLVVTNKGSNDLYVFLNICE